MNYYQPPFYGPYMAPQPMFGQNPYQDNPPVIPSQQSYIENILRMNIGKIATVYMNFENSQWGSKIFKGIILAAGTDHIIIKDMQSEARYLLLTIYLNYITFDEEIEYDYPYRIKVKKETSRK